MQNDTRITVDIAKAVFEIGDRPHRRQGDPGGEPERRHPAGADRERTAAGADLAAPAAPGLDDERTARLNALRGLLRELGVFILVGAENVVPTLWALIEDADSDLPAPLRPVFAEACQEVREIEARIKQVERQLEVLAEQLPAVSHLLSTPASDC